MVATREAPLQRRQARRIFRVSGIDIK